MSRCNRIQHVLVLPPTDVRPTSIIVYRKGKRQCAYHPHNAVMDIVQEVLNKYMLLGYARLDLSRDNLIVHIEAP